MSLSLHSSFAEDNMIKIAAGKPSQKLIIIGAGPAGLAAALLLCKAGLDVEVYEGRNHIPNNPEESYPIGINPRTIHCLNRINPDLSRRAKEAGLLVDSWDIYGGTTRVASLSSKTVFGTTRGHVNLLLYEEVLRNPSIQVHFGHRLNDIDIEKRTLTFTKGLSSSSSSSTSFSSSSPSSAAPELISVDASNARIVAADGVTSKCRSIIAKYCKIEKLKVNINSKSNSSSDSSCNNSDGHIEYEMSPWANEHRVLFAKPGADTPTGLNPGVHYIFNGQYAAALKHGPSSIQWTLVLGAKSSSSADQKEIMSATQPTAENVEKLKKVIKDSAPLMWPLFESNNVELERFFSR